MKSLALAIILAGTAYAGDALQDLINVTAINALNNRKAFQPGATPQVETVSFAQYLALAREYDRLAVLVERLQRENRRLRDSQGWQNEMDPQ